MAILIKRHADLGSVNINLSSSKSESNRALVLNAFTNHHSRLINISDARDTRIMQNLLQSSDRELNVQDAGTTMRFLTAYFSIGSEIKILTGTPRMNERPIKILVDALTEIGADIKYINKEGYPPLEIHPFQGQKNDFIRVRGDISSQYISALLMIAPVLPQGLTLELYGKISSQPYIDMTLALMAAFGVEVSEKDHVYQIKPQKYQQVDYRIESDWSGASYWYSFIALCNSGKVHLSGLKSSSLQGDRAIAEIMSELGVSSYFDEQGVWIEKKNVKVDLNYDFTHCPDLAQTVIVACTTKGIKATFSGLESLRIKETDRILALQNELAKIGARLEEEETGKWILSPGHQLPLKEAITIKTYDDHRMAMAFAPLATMTDLIIEFPDVVKKSYPGFWDDMKKAGFSITEL